MNQKVSVGIGVILLKDRMVLVGKRKGKKHEGFFSIPGGLLEPGESFEDCARREIFEEAGIILMDCRVVCITNNLETSKKEGIHNVSVILASSHFVGEPINCEPEKCYGWQWVSLTNLPEPHFEASKIGISHFLADTFYKPSETAVSIKRDVQIEL